MSEELSIPTAREMFGEAHALCCDNCGTQFGESFGSQPNPNLTILRCMSCAALEEKEQPS